MFRSTSREACHILARTAAARRSMTISSSARFTESDPMCLPSSPYKSCPCHLAGRRLRPNNRPSSLRSNFALKVREKSTLSYHHAVEGGYPPFQAQTLGNVLNNTTDKYPDKEFVVFSADNVRRTFKAFKEEVDSLALGLVHRGVRPGDRVAVCGPNTLEWLRTQYAVASIGAILVTINPASRQTEMLHSLKLAGVKVLVSAASFMTQDYYELISGICPDIAAAKPKRIQSEQLPDLESVVLYSSDSKPGTYNMDDVMSMGSEDDMKLLSTFRSIVRPDNPSTILFTSGTTGFPKAATLSHHAVVNNSRYFSSMINFDSEDHTCCGPVPFSHIFGAVLVSIGHVTYGQKLVVPSPSFKPESTIQAIHNEKCTALYATPTLLISILHHESIDRYDVSSVRTVFIGASPIPPEKLTLAQRIMGLERLVVGYGLTETSVVTVSYPDDPEEKRLTTVGRVMPYMEVKVIDPATRDILPVGEPGELCIRGYSTITRSHGYWGQQDKTEDTIDEHGWFHTGDMASMDEDGYCRIVGRYKDVIIRGGSNIYPTEVENLIHTHPAVQEVQVLGIPDKIMGEEVGAVIIVKPGMQTTEEDIRSFCRGKISHYKIPRYVRFASTYPLTTSGKVQKFQLRLDWEKYTASSSTDVL